MRFISSLLLAFTILLGGCAHMHIVCQDAGTTSLAVGGNTVGSQILATGLALAGAAASGAKLMALAPAPKAAPTAQSQSYIDYQYLAAFGPDYASCTTTPPPQPPTTSIMFLSPNGGAPQMLSTDAHQVVIAPPQK